MYQVIFRIPDMMSVYLSRGHHVVSANVFYADIYRHMNG